MENFALPDPKSLGNLWNDMAKFQDSIEEIQRSLTNPKESKLLSDMVYEMRKTQAEAERKVPQVVLKMQEQAEKGRMEAQQLMNEINRQKAEMEARFEAAEKLKGTPAPSAPPPPQADPSLNPVLSSELLRKYGFEKTPGHTYQEDSSFVDPADSDAWEKSVGLPAAPSILPREKPPEKQPEKPTPPKKAARDGDDDLWEGMSEIG